MKGFRGFCMVATLLALACLGPPVTAEEPSPEAFTHAVLTLHLEVIPSVNLFEVDSVCVCSVAVATNPAPEVTALYALSMSPAAPESTPFNQAFSTATDQRRPLNFEGRQSRNRQTRARIG